MTADDYQQLAARTAKQLPTLIDDLQHALLGLTSETGELADAIKKHTIYGKELDKANIKEELGDLAWYLALAATALNVSLDEVFADNIMKLAKRYPEKYTDQAALARADKLSEADPWSGQLGSKGVTMATGISTGLAYEPFKVDQNGRISCPPNLETITKADAGEAVFAPGLETITK
jgi:NTP pyrophosphatase (non-canonical NTP hydrolase)